MRCDVIQKAFDLDRGYGPRLEGVRNGIEVRGDSDGVPVALDFDL